MRWSEQDELQRLPLIRSRSIGLGARFIGFLVLVRALLGAADARAHYERCTIYMGTDTCLAGDTCTARDGGAGICIPPPCTGDGDCMKAPLRQCDKRQSPAVCVECYGDGECAAGTVCELDPRSFVSNRCVECAVGRAGSCASSDAGRSCVLERGACGCADHADCAPAQFCRRSECIPRPTSGVQTGRDSGAEAGDPASVPAIAEASLAASGSGCSTSTGGGSAGALTIATLVLARCLRRRKVRVLTSRPDQGATVICGSRE